MKNDSNQIYNLDKLIEYIGADEEAIKNMISIFLSTTPDLLLQLKDGLQAENFDEIARSAHKLKPTLDIFGIDNLHEPIRFIEVHAKQKKNLPKIIESSALVKQTLEQVFIDLKRDYKL